MRKNIIRSIVPILTLSVLLALSCPSASAQSGLFTYYLALGLHGDADTDGNGAITFDELVGYVTSGVSSESRKIRGGDQPPQFYGTGDFVIGKIK